MAWIGILLSEGLFLVLSCAAEHLLIPRNVFFNLWVYKKVWESADPKEYHTHTAHTLPRAPDIILKGGGGGGGGGFMGCEFVNKSEMGIFAAFAF